MVRVVYASIVTEDVMTGVGQENGCGVSERSVIEWYGHLQWREGGYSLSIVGIVALKFYFEIYRTIFGIKELQNAHKL